MGCFNGISQDSEIKKKKSECYADIDSGLWGGHCKSSSIAKENCALKCLSPACYELIYESDPLEEGEKDYIRSQEFKYCMYNHNFVNMLQLQSSIYSVFVRMCPSSLHISARQFADHCFAIAEDHRLLIPNCYIHGFGIDSSAHQWGTETLVLVRQRPRFL
ncbi:hypothetical protein GOBAR_AA27865 [Gossypium barbadense]|uniref:Uncharacterized protein n=1 Tax=Gossypium barbadense TaxID=3634 RepID=A0A2P5WNZ1_GOSBA|nr:hypothetical protein GOBAR_AA27865 [Gossypium barbadense]